ncbi:MAG: chromosome segregation protein SMC [Firmicutes bacterium]|nr:chromosome segregation protein SMC [Bacillota bacterium]
MQIIGFKSFADRTVLEFGPGLTAVVGPNGSGKSNIADAIRWVTGEHNARHLRGARLDDIIFAGTETRRQAGWAEVELVLDNADGLLPVPAAEVAVARRVDRAGGSEALINGTPCRTRDIVDLFSGTGVGPRAYAFVGQGQVETVLDGRPEDRRTLVEEAAGITRYRARCLEAERHLQRVEPLIERLRERVRELEARLLPLARQAERARRREALDAEARRLGIGLLRAEWEELRRRLERLEERAARESEALAAHRREAEELEAELAARQAEREAAEAEEAQAVAAAEALRRELDSAARRLAQAREQFSLRSAQRRQVEARLDALRQSLARAQERRSEEEARWAEARAALEAVEREAEPALARREAADTELAEARRRLRAAQEELLEAERRLASLEADARGLEEREREEAARRQERLAEAARRLEEAEKELRRAEAELEAARRRDDESRAAWLAAEERRERAEAELRAAQEELAAAQRREAEARSRAEVWEDVRRSAAGYADGPRAVLQAWRRGHPDLAEVLGAVAELVRVPAELERAIEVALGGSAQDIVVRSGAGAERAIAWLKREKAGRATFLPLDGLRSTAPAERERELARRPEAVGWAAELVAAPPEVEPAVRHLLGRVLVARTLEAARRLAAASGYRVRVVTLEGDVVHPGGAMTGGEARRAGPGLVARERAAAEAAAALRAAAQESAAAAATARRAAAALEAARAEAARLASAARDAERARAFAERAHAEAAEAVERARAAAEDARSAAAAARGGAAASEDDAAARRAEAEERRRQAREAAAAAAAAVERAEAAVRAAAERALAAGARRAEAAAAVQAAERARERAAAEAAALERETAALRDELAAAETGLAPLREEVASAEEERARLEAALEAAEDGLRERRRRRLEVQAALAELERDRRSLEQALHEASQAAHETALQAAQAQARLDALLSRARELYDIDEAALARAEAVRDPGAPSRLAALRAELSALGAVDRDAVTLYEQERARYEEARQDLADLEAARDALQAVLEALKRRMDAVFRETLRAVRAAFRETFQELFGGGEADLVPLAPGEREEDAEAAVGEARPEAGGERPRAEGGRESGSAAAHAPAPDEPVAGLVVRARPPGKRTDRLTLLSGGERALTAIALLFALLKVQPAPFCVLDEIDAALDEANVGRFAEFLREMSRRTQFLIITHQRGTMEAADRLFGVTMSERGVSQVVSVTLTDADRPASA